MNADQLLSLVITPALQHIGAYSEAAAELVLGTGIQESHLKYLKQLNNGPAVGIFQMEPATYSDIKTNYLAYRHDLAAKIKELELPRFADNANEMIGNLYYAAAMCRVHYLRVFAALPVAGDLVGQATYWKAHYNTHHGKGTVEEYIENWKRYR